jgi:hypothetical protein
MSPWFTPRVAFRDLGRRMCERSRADAEEQSLRAPGVSPGVDTGTLEARLDSLRNPSAKTLRGESATSAAATSKLVEPEALALSYIPMPQLLLSTAELSSACTTASIFERKQTELNRHRCVTVTSEKKTPR